MDKRFFAQILFHLTRLDVSECEDEVKQVMGDLRKLPAADWFCDYRDDVDRLLASP